MSTSLESQLPVHEAMRAWADLVPTLAWVSGCDKQCVYFNRQWQEFTGSSLEELLGEQWVKDVHPEDRQRWLEIYLGSFDLRKQFTREYRLRRHDGQYRLLAEAGAPCFSADGVFMGYTGTAVDISDLGISDGSVRERAARFRALFDRNVVPLAFWTVDGKIIDANKAYLKLTGYTRQDLRKGGLRCDGLTPAEYQELDRRAITELRAGKAAARTYEKEYLRRDGRRVPVLIAGSLLPGYLDRGVVCALDLTSRKKTEARLEESRSLLDSVFKSLNGLVVVINSSGQVIALKQPQTAVFRRKSTVHAGVRIGANYVEAWKAAHLSGDRDAGLVSNGIAGVLERKLPEFKLEYSCPGLPKPTWFEVAVQPLSRPEGGALITQVDITRRRETELEAELLLRELAHVTRITMLGELAASFTHELSQPLAAMLNNSVVVQRLLSKRDPDTARLQEIVGDIVALSRRAKKIIERLRKLLGKGKAQLKAINFNKLLIEVVDLLRDEAILKKVRVVRELAHGLPLVCGDRIQLQQVSLNLIVNAFEAMRRIPAPLRELTIRTFVSSHQFVTLEVQDAGPGIPPDKLETVFNPFFTTKSEGMGMGLSICRSIIKAHHGQISATNAPGGGAIFRVVLPVIDSTADAI